MSCRSIFGKQLPRWYLEPGEALDGKVKKKTQLDNPQHPKIMKHLHGFSLSSSSGNSSGEMR